MSAVGAGLAVERLDGDRVAVLRISRPERGNALTPALLRALEAEVAGLAASGARAAVLAGAGGKAFSTGYDVAALATELASAADAGAKPLPEDHPLERALRAIDLSPVPIVAAIDGAATGAGCELACACDLRVAGDGARLGFPPAKIGLLYSHTGIARVVALAGAGLAREMFLLGTPVDAARAERLGLVTRVVAAGKAEEEAIATARALAANAPLSLSGTKAVINRFLAPPRLSDADLAEIAALRERCFRSADLAEGLQAFLERRAPRFEGR